MTDVVDRATRSRMMSGIRSTNTKPELLVRKILHAEGLRFRLHARDLPGKPDIVFPKYMAVVFVNGCFWHGHMCKLFKFPSTRPEFWKDKIAANVARDGKTREKLIGLGWRIAVVWECAIKGKSVADAKIVLLPLVHWLSNSLDTEKLEI